MYLTDEERRFIALLKDPVKKQELERLFGAELIRPPRTSGELLLSVAVLPVPATTPAT